MSSVLVQWLWTEEMEQTTWVGGLHWTPSTQMRFQKCPFSSWRKRSKMLSPTLPFSYRFVSDRLGPRIALVLKSQDHMPSWKDAPVWTGGDAGCDAFYVNVLKSLRFDLTTLETKRFKTMRFQKSPFSLAFLCG